MDPVRRRKEAQMSVAQHDTASESKAGVPCDKQLPRISVPHSH